MKMRTVLPVLTASLLTAGLFGAAWTQQSKAPTATADTIKLSEAPPAVQAAINKITAGKTIKNIARETDGGVTTYEVEFESDGQMGSADVTADGNMLAVESVVKTTALPKAVADKIASHNPKAVIKHAEMVQEFYYEIQVEVDGQPHEVKINAAGEVVGGDSKQMKDDDDDDGEQDAKDADSGKKKEKDGDDDDDDD